MFDVGFSELVLIFVIGLIVLGPERLPKVARTLGRWLGRARQMARSMQYELERELDLSEMGADRANRSSTVTPHPDVSAPPLAASEKPAAVEPVAAIASPDEGDDAKAPPARDAGGAATDEAQSRADRAGG